MAAAVRARHASLVSPARHDSRAAFYGGRLRLFEHRLRTAPAGLVVARRPPPGRRRKRSVRYSYEASPPQPSTRVVYGARLLKGRVCAGKVKPGWISFLYF